VVKFYNKRGTVEQRIKEGFQMAEAVVPRILFREILDRIRQLRFSTITARPG